MEKNVSKIFSHKLNAYFIHKTSKTQGPSMNGRTERLWDSEKKVYQREPLSFEHKVTESLMNT